MAKERFQHENTILASGKWTFFKTCTCGGTLKHKYKYRSNAQRTLQIMPNKHRFNVVKNGVIELTGEISNMNILLNDSFYNGLQ